MSTAIESTSHSQSIITCPMCGHRHKVGEVQPVQCIACGELMANTKSAASLKLFSPMQVAAAGFLGGWLAGFIVMAINYLRLKRIGAAILSLGAGSLMLLGWMKLAVSVAAVAKVPGMLLWMVVMLVTLAVAKIMQGAVYDQHLAAGGEQAKGAAALGYMVLAIGISLAMGVMLLLVLA